MPVALIPAAIGLVSGVVKYAQGKHQENLASKITVPDANYADSPYAQAMLQQAKQIKNARMPGAANAEQSIMGNQANTVDAINRNSQSGAQALSLITGAQGNTNEALKGLATQQEQFSYNAANNLQSVLGTFADNTFQGQLRKQMLAIQQKNALGLASTQNMGSGMNDVLNGVMASTNAGGFGKYGGTTPPAAAHG